jgi:hypothetical protein
MARFLFVFLIGCLCFPKGVLAVDRFDGQAESGQRDRTLRGEAIELARQGDTVAAMRKLAGVKTPSILAQAIRDVDSAYAAKRTNGGSKDSGADVSGGTSAAVAGQVAAGQGAAGQGGAMIDFGPLINLIQTTIAPDTWQDTVGGPSTIAPYAAGIVVAPDGLITDILPTPDPSGLLENIAVMLARDHRQEAEFATPKGMVDAWRLPSDLRCVSLRGVADKVAVGRLTGRPIDDELRHIAGLSRVRYIVLDRGNEDVLLVGKVGGIESCDGWMRDSRSGSVTMRLDHLAACLQTVISRQPMGCSIDPTQDALHRAADVSVAIGERRIAAGIADEAMRDALGDQVVRVFGVAGDTSIAHLMVHADRHMKRLALGLEPMPRGVDNYLDVVTKQIRKGPPNGQLLRLWFAANPTAVRRSTDGQTYELGGRSMVLQSETQLAGLAGQRLAAADDARLVEYVSGFNRNLDAIARQYPTYAALETVYHSAAVAELIHRTDSKSNLNRWLGPLLMDDPWAGNLNAPKRVPSIAVAHEIRAGGKKHFIVVASGGVVVQSADLIGDQQETYPSLDPLSLSFSRPQPADLGRWWWDIQR